MSCLPCRVTFPQLLTVQKSREALFAEMTSGSNRSLAISKTGIQRNQFALCRQPGSEKTCHFSESRTKNQRHIKPPCLCNCLTFCFKDEARMEQREPPVASQADGTEGRLRELASKWFIDTQVPLIVHNGLFPTWFLGFTSRKGAEEILREKEQGCFLIRLSDKAIGYILSYKGKDRCRHFMINQSESGHFVVCGDTGEHDTVSDLIEYYKTSPIQPFGEYLTSSCFEAPNEELYDTIQFGPKENPVKNMCQQQIHLDSEQPPMRPPKSSRTLEEAPPVPRRSRNLDSASLNDQDSILYAQLRKHSPREIPRFHHYCQDSSAVDNPGRADRYTTQNIGRCSPSSKPDSLHSDLGLLEGKNLSVPILDDSSDPEHPYRLSVSPRTPPRLSPKAIRQGARYDLDKIDSCSRPSSSHSLEYMSDGAVYHLAGGPGNPHATLSGTRSEQQGYSVYAEVVGESLGGHSSHASRPTCELIPGHEDPAKEKTNSHTYEPLEDIRLKHNHTTWGFKNDKWRWLFPEVKRK